jgi:mRNA interferase MazF
MSSYLPGQGDIVWIDLNPQTGHKQAGRRPAVIVSNRDTHSVLNQRAMVCPITNTNKGSPFQPKLDDRTKTKGVIQCDQARFVDVAARKAEYIEKLPGDILDEAVDIVFGMIEVL